MNPQTEKVLSLLRRGPLTRLTAMHYGVMNLTARLADLRGLGYRISCASKRDANGARYGEFTLVSERPKKGDRVRFTDKVPSHWWVKPGMTGVILRDIGGRNSLPFDVAVDGHGENGLAHVNVQHIEVIR